MQVTHVQDHVSHAVISSGKARDFGISDSAEFFNILSNTLYSDKILAVVREVLCNAWDIHIQTGRTDRPVEVTLAGGKLTIRDFGTGISDDDIHPIYAVYGNSTKKLDGKQTGGFGLGSKAPFAYVDHFEVTSYHAGRRTIYAVSKSSAEVAGKPSIMPIVSTDVDHAQPGDETGLAVSLNVRNEDVSRFREVIRMITRFGEMNVRLTYNGVSSIQPTIAFSKAKHGFLMSRTLDGIPNSANLQVFVRYGNVVYPVPEHELFKAEYHSILKLLARVGHKTSNPYSHGHTTWKIILQARPDTISVTPSRESLSMTDHTASNLLELMRAFLTLSEGQLEQACLDIERQTIARMWDKDHGRPADLLTSANKILTLFDRQVGSVRQAVTEPENITTVQGIGQAYMAKTYPDFSGFRARDVEMRLNALEKAGFGGRTNRGKLQSFRREYQRIGNAHSSWFQHQLVQPLVRKLDAVPELSGDKLLVYGEHVDRRVDKNGRRRNYNESAKSFVEASKLSPRKLEGYMPFLRNFVVISFNRSDVQERLGLFPIMTEELGSCEEMFVYVVSRTDKKVEVVRKFFAEQGMTVVDLTVRQDWEPKNVVQAPKPRYEVKPRKKGLPTLASLLTTNHPSERTVDHTRLRIDHAVFENLARIENPQFILKLNPRAQQQVIMEGVTNENLVSVVSLYGHLGGVVVNDNQYARFRDELKIPGFRSWLLARIRDEVLSNTRIQGVFGYSPACFPQDIQDKLDSSHRVMLKTILHNPDLAIEFGVLNEVNQEDKTVLAVANNLLNQSWAYGHDAVVTEIRKHVDSIQPTPEVLDLARSISESTLVRLLNASNFSEIFGEKATQAQKLQRPAALDILQYAVQS